MMELELNKKISSSKGLTSMLANKKLGNTNLDASESKDFKAIYQEKTESKRPETVKKDKVQVKDEKKLDPKEVLEELEEASTKGANKNILEILMALMGMVEVDLENPEEVEELLSEINLILESMDMDKGILEGLQNALGEILEEVELGNKSSEIENKLKDFLDELEKVVDDSDQESQELLAKVKGLIVGESENKSMREDSLAQFRPVVSEKSEETRETKEIEELEETGETEEVQKVSNKNQRREIRQESEDSGEEMGSEVDSFKDNVHLAMKAKDNPILNPENKMDEILKLGEVEENEVIKQIVDGVKFNVQGDKSQIRMHLKPEALGQMLMNLEVSKGELVAKILVQNEKTKEIIQNNLLTLQEELEETGMEIKTFEVFVGSDSDFEDQNERFNFFNQNQGQNKKFRNKKAQESVEQISTDYEAGTIVEESNPYLIEGGFDLKA